MSESTRSIHGIDLVRCEPRHLWLREAACINDWRRARKHPDPEHANYLCVGCATGCARAGEAPEMARRDRALSKRKWCVRCHRPATRLIHKRLCVSCYNRQREAGVGRDRRGRVPRNAPRLYLADLLLGAPACISVVRVARVASTLEAALVLCREQDSPVFISRHVQPVRGQQRLFG